MVRGTGIQLDSATGDLFIRQGSMVVGDTTSQNQALILYAHKGEFKEYPIFGVGISDMVNDDRVTGWAREIAIQMEADGMTVGDIAINFITGELTIDAKY